jgi:hypothetical protein
VTNGIYAYVGCARKSGNSIVILALLPSLVGFAIVHAVNALMVRLKNNAVAP